MDRAYTWNAGPSAMPLEVLKEAQAEFLDFQNTGMSVIEISHRSAEYSALHRETKALLRELMEIPEDYEVLFCQGGGSTQFLMMAANFFTKARAAYVNTGVWAGKALKEAQFFGEAYEAASSADKNHSYIPQEFTILPDTSYVHLTANNTIYGTKFHTLPNTKGKTLVADMSSCFLSEPFDVTKYGLIFAGAQKNIGPAGTAVVIIREDLITEDVLPGTPTMLRYSVHAKENSMYNTPPCYGIYICGKVFRWIRERGGLEAMKRANEEKAKVLYDYLDSSRLFKPTVVKRDRSLMNVPFVTGSEELDALFVARAKDEGLLNLKGHRTVGGMRASIYNAMPKAGVEKLVNFMEQFEKERSK